MASYEPHSTSVQGKGSGKPVKSILKQNGTSSRNSSWLGRLSSVAPSPASPSPESTPIPQSRSFFQKLMKNGLSNEAAPSILHESSVSPSSPEDGLVPDELKRVRFSVGQLTTEHYLSDTSDPNALDEKTQSPMSMESGPSLPIRPISIHNVIAFYLSSCRAKEEPALSALLKTLHAHQHDTHLEYLNLSNQPLHRRMVEPLADILCLDFGLRGLTLDNSDLEDDGLKILLHSLLLNNNITHLSLKHNRKIKTTGFKYIAIFVKTSSLLAVLDLSMNCPDKKAIQHLVHAISPTPTPSSPSLHTLILDGCGLSTQMLEILANGVRKSTCLRVLSLRNNHITSLGSKWIGVMLVDYNNPEQTVGLAQLILDDNEIRQGVALISQALRRNQYLTRLSMRNCKLDAKGFALIGEALKYNQQLERLDIGYNGQGHFTLEAMNTFKEALYSNHALQHLGLATTGLDSEVVIALAECLSENKSLKRLDISDNPAVDLAGALALVASLRNNETLTSFDMTVPLHDRDMARCLADIGTLCARNRQLHSDDSPMTPTRNPSEQTQRTAKTQMTARMTLQERLAAVTGASPLSPMSSTFQEIPSMPARRELDAATIDTITNHMSLLNEMVSAHMSPSSDHAEPDEVVQQLFRECQEAQATVCLSIPDTTDEGQLGLLLSLNDHLTSALINYDKAYYGRERDETPQPVTDETTSLHTSSSPFEIGDDDEEEGEEHKDLLVDESSETASVTNLAERRRAKELEESEAFRRAKGSDPDKVPEEGQEVEGQE